MTKKDYVLIAKVIKEYLDNGDNDQIDGIAGVERLTRMLADKLGKENTRFDKNRFLKACGLYNVAYGECVDCKGKTRLIDDQLCEDCENKLIK